MINDIASFILWLIVAVFLLHVIEGNAQEWVKSKFKVASPPDLAPSSFGSGALDTPGNPASSLQTGDRSPQNTTNPNPKSPGFI